jgi:chemotaxis receptor (MCP) glutamine deamidase CheD
MVRARLRRAISSLMIKEGAVGSTLKIKFVIGSSMIRSMDRENGRGNIF